MPGFGFSFSLLFFKEKVNPLNAELNPICHLLALLGAHHILHVGRIRVKVKVKQFRYRPGVARRVPGS